MSDQISYLHCKKCLEELPQGESPASYSRLEVGVTDEGNVLVWCQRHDLEVATLTPEIISDIAENPRCSACEEGSDEGHKH